MAKPPITPADPAQLVDPLQPNLVMYLVMQASPILSADGTPAYAMVGQTQDMLSAMDTAARLGNCAVIAQVVLARFLPHPPKQAAPKT